MGVMPEIVFRNVGNHRSVLPLGNLELKDLLHVHQVLRLCIANILHREFSHVENFTLIAIKLFMSQHEWILFFNLVILGFGKNLGLDFSIVY